MRQNKQRPGGKNWFNRIVSVFALIGIGAAWTWGVLTVFAPPANIPESLPYTYTEITAGEVSSTLNLNTTAQWEPTPIANNLATGVVTAVLVTAGQEVSAGDILYTVSLRPVVIAQGEIPAFRSLAQGDTGADVAQLQSFLSDLEFFSGEADGTFSYKTHEAVRAWQKSLGLARDGVVQAGDIVFAPNLPVRISLDSEKISRGATLAGGEAAIFGLPQSPVFTILATDTQSGMIPAGIKMLITGPDEQNWSALAGGRTRDPQNGVITIQVDGTNGGAVCGQECASIPVTSASSLRTQIIIVEPVSGLSVPSAALLTRADGTILVLDRDGVEHQVSVIASARGMSIIEGAPAGLAVRVPASEI